MRAITTLTAVPLLLNVLSVVCAAQTTRAAIPAEMGLTLEMAAVAQKPMEASPAERAGFRAGDCIVALDGTPLASAAEFGKAIAARPQRAVVRVTVIRDGREQVVEATLDTFAPAPAPAEGAPAPRRGRLGLPFREELVIGTLAPDGLAAKAGVRRGDELTAVNAGSVDAIDEATVRLAGARHRGQAKLQLDRGGGTERVVVTLPLGKPVPYVVTPQDDADAAGHFSDLGALHVKIDADLREGKLLPTHLYEEDFYTGVVEAIVPDSPEFGEATVVLATPGRAKADTGVVVFWKVKGFVSGLARGQNVYFRGRINRVELREGQARVDALLVQGRHLFSSPGEAFNPTRPLLRSGARNGRETVEIASVMSAVRADAARAKADYEGKTLVFEGTARRLLTTGKDTYEIHFDPGADADVSTDSAVLRLRSDLGGALAGFKPGQILRFRGSLQAAERNTAERENWLDGGTIRRTETKLIFQLSTMFIEQTPL